MTAERMILTVTVTPEARTALMYSRVFEVDITDAAPIEALRQARDSAERLAEDRLDRLERLRGEITSVYLRAQTLTETNAQILEHLEAVEAALQEALEEASRWRLQATTVYVGTTGPTYIDLERRTQ